MGIWDTYCLICGNSCFAEKDLEFILKFQFKVTADIKGLNSKLKWLNNCTVLAANNDVIHGCNETDGGATFFKDKKIAYTCDIFNGFFDYFRNDYINKGIAIHTDCWKFIKKVYKIELKYKDLPISEQYYNYDAKIGDVNYGSITKYQSQFMEYHKMYLDKNIYMVTSPLSKTDESKKNIPRIKKIISQFKFKNDPKRKGPSVSATFYNEGSIKLGNNNKFWIKQNGKWNEMKDEVITKKIEFKKNTKNKIINDIPQLGEFNNKLLFVKSFTRLPNKIVIEFIGSPLLINKIK